MAELRVHDFSISLDGYGAGPRQGVDDPLGVGGDQLHEWAFAADAPEVDRQFRARGTVDIGATIMGRNMFGPVRGSWEEGWVGREEGEEWRGWWGDDPPFHHDVFVLTHHSRDPLPMDGGTTFHFVTEGIEAALDRARTAAGDRHVRLGGGAATVQQYLRAGLLDELHVVVVPVLLHSGERLFANLGGALEGWECVEHVPSRSVTHVRLRRP
jgi:dihydrofolate reductase